MERKGVKYSEAKSPAYDSAAEANTMEHIEGTLQEMDYEKVRHLFPSLYDINRQWTWNKGPLPTHYSSFDDETNMVIEIANLRYKALELQR